MKIILYYLSEPSIIRNVFIQGTEKVQVTERHMAMQAEVLVTPLLEGSHKTKAYEQLLEGG